MRILVVHNNLDAAEMVKDVIEDRVKIEGRELFVDYIRNQAEAMRRLKGGGYDLIITHLHIPVDKKSGVIESEQRGLVLLQSLETEHIRIPSILVSITPDPQLVYAVQDLHQASLLIEGEEFEDRLIRYCTRALSQLESPEARSEAESPKKEKAAHVDLKLDLRQNIWEFVLKGTGGDLNYYADGVLQIDTETMSDLVDQSRELQEITNWEKALRRIGRVLEKELFKNNYDFSVNFRELKTLVNDERKIKFRFEVAKEVHPIVLEALAKKDDYWMLKSPIYRRLRRSGSTNPLYYGQKTWEADINCLIIESNLPEGAYVAEIDKEFKYLENVPEESKWLEGYLEDRKAELNIGEVERINKKKIPEGKTFKEHVKNVLKRHAWHLVHYAGHSFCDETSDKAYLFFPEKDYVNAINIMEFSEWLRGAKTAFVYLSSCHSSEEDFAFELVKNEIPAVIGFRWDIDDKMAADHTEKFYKHLFEETRSLEYAFLETRKEIYNDYKDNRVWAAPVLILQVSD